MAYALKRSAPTTSSRPWPASHHSPQHPVAKTPRFDDRLASIPSSSPPSLGISSPISRCSSTSSDDSSFCSIDTPTASSADSGDEDESDCQEYDSDSECDYVYDDDDDDEDDEAEEDEEDIVVELISILKKPRITGDSGCSNGADDQDDSDDESECDVVFERNVSFDDPLATDMVTGAMVPQTLLSREEWTAIKLRESIERGGSLISSADRMEGGLAERLAEEEEEEEDEDGSQEQGHKEDDEADIYETADADADSVVEFTKVRKSENSAVKTVDTNVCHTLAQTDKRHRSWWIDEVGSLKRSD
ncbi:hypothetical protein GGS20DRAFT_568666 [Poronia punctata]|nr:hypothetical protein GGS20DRAFT_568666 [Poronia punctata]